MFCLIGAKCESDIDECDSTPCQNGGLCIDGMGDFQCQCQPGFVGMGNHNLKSQGKSETQIQL